MVLRSRVVAWLWRRHCESRYRRHVSTQDKEFVQFVGSARGFADQSRCLEERRLYAKVFWPSPDVEISLARLHLRVGCCEELKARCCRVSSPSPLAAKAEGSLTNFSHFTTTFSLIGTTILPSLCLMMLAKGFNVTNDDNATSCSA